jgi:protoporphyrinogen/coproporphyrinogen III oxidase
VKHLVIVGGGIAGLSAAWNAVRRRRGLQVTIVEREEALGGKIRTDSEGPYLLEQGPDSFLTSRPEAVRLCEEIGLAERFQERTPRPVHTYIMRRHVLSPLPGGFFGAVPMDTAALAVSPLLSEAGKKRAMEEPSMPAWSGGDDESVASLMVRRFGEEAFQVLVEPLVGGIHAGDAALLSAQATMPRKEPRLMENLGHVEGLTRPQFVTFPRGTAELIHALEKRLDGVRIQRGTAVESVRRGGRTFTVELSGGGKLDADAILLAAPAHEAGRLAAPLDRELPDLLRLIPSASTVVIHLAYRRPDVTHALDGYGYLIPSIERSDLVACTWISRKWEGRAPDDRVLFRLFAGRFGRRDLLGTSDQELFDMARSELAATLGVHAEPELQRLHRWSLGMPQYTVGHLRRVQDIRARATNVPGLFLAGAAYDGVGIPQCVASGIAAEEAAAGFLST